MVQASAKHILGNICRRSTQCDLKTITASQENFLVASLILFYLSNWRTDIIHTPLAHGCGNSCAEKILCYVASSNGPADLPHFNQTLENNAMWRSYDQIKNYDLLNKLLVLAASGIASSELGIQIKTHIFVVNRLLECGAQPGPTYVILNSERLTALLAVLRHIASGDVKIEVAKTLFKKCTEKQQEELANTSAENGWTALHIASLNNNANICQMLLDYGAKLNVQNEFHGTALHLAVQYEHEAVVNVLMEHPDVIEVVDLKDGEGSSPLDIALATGEKFVAMLLFKSKQPGAYFDKVNLEGLLRFSLLNGFVDTVEKLFEKGTKLPASECDNKGKTALHLAAMCEDGSKAIEMVKIVFENIEVKESLLTKQDKRGRTALHEAALNGNRNFCRYLLNINTKIINLKDKNGRTPIYDAVNGKNNEKDVLEMLLNVYFERNTRLNVLADRNGLTPLHIAASLGKTDLVELLLSRTEKASEYLKKNDFLGQTALHKAANCGDSYTVEILLTKGAHPLEERDCDGRTALHYAVNAKNEGDEIKLAHLLLKKCKTNEEKWLLLWASAAGLGTADKSLSNDDPLHKFLVSERNKIKALLATGNLLKTATAVGDIEMTKELIARGYQIADICDTQWRTGLTEKEEKNVKTVSSHLERIAQQVNDQPTALDNLGRIDYAHGLAALLLNPYIKPPIIVGISGSSGTGKSSLMVQTESILLETAAQMALLPSAKLSSVSELPDISTSALSIKGKKKCEEIKGHVNFEQNGKRTLFSTIMDKIWSWLKKNNREESQVEIKHTKQDSLVEFLNSYQPKYRKIFKSLAAMDSRDMFTKVYQLSKSNSVPPVEESVPAILTVNYNPWKCKDEKEAIAGMAVDIARELEGIMTKAQWLSTSWRNTWKKKKYNIWIEIIYPCLLAIVLACTLAWILWVVLDRSDKFKGWAISKYAFLPTGLVTIEWTITKSVMGILKPVSKQLMNYQEVELSHTEKLSYQERVLSDITFLKKEIGKRPCLVFEAYSWLSSVISTLWLLFFEWWLTSFFFNRKIIGNTMPIPERASVSGTNLRRIVFIDDLDRCQESVILQVLSAINLVLAVCEINVVLGIDKGMIERAIIKKYGGSKTNMSFKDNKELAEKYLQKIIQLPLDLPDPSEEQSKKFLEGQLGVFKESSESADSEIEQDAEARRSRESTSLNFTEREIGVEIVSEAAMDAHSDTMNTRHDHTSQILHFFKQINKRFLSSLPTFCGRKNKTKPTSGDAAVSLSSQTGSEAQQEGNVTSPKNSINKMSNKKFWSWIPLRELLFVRYSKGEQDAFCYFQKLSTDSRKFPREWKRFLNYHRLVWYIFYLTREARDLAGWQVQFITWIFVCWEWQENMNFVIQNWNEFGVLKTIESDRPSLYMIIDHYIETENKKHTKEIEDKKHMKEIRASLEKLEKKEVFPETRDTNDKNNEMESNKTSEKDITEIMSGVDVGLLEKKLMEKFDELKEEIKDKVMKQHEIKDELKREIQDLKDQVMKQYEIKDELKKEIQDLKDQVMKQHSMKNQKMEEEKKIKLKQWKRMRSALYNYDVTMDGILAFQRFRFYCIAGHLSWPLPKQENNEQ